MKINVLKYIFYVNLVFNFITGTYLYIYIFVGIDSFVINNNKICISPLYRTKINKLFLRTTPDTIKTVSELVALKFDKKKEDIDPEKDFFKEFGADRLDEVELLISIEDEFDLSISDKQFKTLRTVKDISKYIDSKLQANNV